MATSSASRAGFRAIRRQPAVLLAEIAWRWSWGVAALAVLAVSVRAYLQSITVTNADLMELKSRMPTLVADAIARMLAGSGATLARLAAVVVPAVAILWILAASLGRGATLQALFPQSPKARLRTLLGVHFLRAAAALAGVICYMGAAMLASWAAGPPDDTNPQAIASNLVLFVFVFLVIVLLVVTAWSTVNWFLSLAPVFVVRDGRDTFGSLAEAEGLFRRHKREFTGVGFLFGLIKFFFIGAVTVLSLAALALLGQVPGWVVTAIIVVLTLLYLAAADFLYIARLAAYIDIAERDSLERAAVSPQPQDAIPAGN
jgi:hypothetical protein